MANKIIDFNCHLGDVTHTNQCVTFKTEEALQVSIVDLWDRDKAADLYQDFAESYYEGTLRDGNKEQNDKVVEAALRRSHLNTLKKVQGNMDEYTISYSVLLPITPNMFFEEYKVVSMMDSRFIPFTSPVFSLNNIGTWKKVLQDIFTGGAKGVNINPALQNISLKDKKVINVMRALEETDVPVVIYTGDGPCYRESDPYPTNPSYSKVECFIDLAKRFTNVKIVAAHAGGINGLGEEDKLAQTCKDMPNVYVDTALRSSKQIRKLVNLFGADRVLFGTNNPFGDYKASVNNVIKAFEDDEVTLNKVLYENAAKLLQIRE